MNKIKALVILLISSMLLTACGGAPNYRARYESESASVMSGMANIEMADAVMPSANSFDGAKGFSTFKELTQSVSDTSINVTETESITEDVSDYSENQKLIRTVSMQVQIDTSEHLSETVESLSSMSDQFGGWTEVNKTDFNSKSAYGRLVLRIPQNNVDAFLKELDETGLSILNINDNSEDVTLTYNDIETKVKVKEIERDKYIAYLEKAETIEDILTIERRIDEVVAELEGYKTTFQVLKNKVDYSKISIDIMCATTITPEPIKASLWDIFTDAMGDLWEDIVFEFIYGLEYVATAIASLILIVPLYLGIIYIGIKVIKRAIFGKREKNGSKERKGIKQLFKNLKYSKNKNNNSKSENNGLKEEISSDESKQEEMK